MKCDKMVSLHCTNLELQMTATGSPGERSWVAGEAPCLEDRGVHNLIQDRSCL